MLPEPQISQQVLLEFKSFLSIVYNCQSNETMRRWAMDSADRMDQENLSVVDVWEMYRASIRYTASDMNPWKRHIVYRESLLEVSAGKLSWESSRQTSWQDQANPFSRMLLEFDAGLYWESVLERIQ